MQLHYWQPPIPESYTTASPDHLADAITRRRKLMGDRLVILGHHYQTDEVVRHADFTGDSLKLSQLAAERVGAVGIETVIFCGVHFMAESADLLTPDGTAVILPDLAAGCSMADMADYEDAVDAWNLIHAALTETGWRGRIIPITYINSSAAIKAFVGANGGVCCTSSNAPAVFDWAMRGGTKPDQGDDIKVLFLPDQHLGRNTAAAYDIDTDANTCVYDPRLTRKGEPYGGPSLEQLVDSRVILWAGHCSVHKLFRPEHCDQIRADSPETTILVHPECAKEVVDKADLAGSTEFIIRTLRNAPVRSKWAVGTEFHLVNRLRDELAPQGIEISTLSGCQCLCTTMYRIDQPHLLWVLDNLAEGKIVNRVEVHKNARRDALIALDRMLEMKAGGPVAGAGR